MSEIKFRLASEEKPRIMVPVRVNGKGPFRFVLDTGASSTVLSEELSKSLGVSEEATKEGMSCTETVSVGLGSAGPVEIGTAKVEKLEVATMDFAHLREAVGTAIDGIVGYSFLGHFRLGIDYANRLLRLDSTDQ